MLKNAAGNGYPDGDEDLAAAACPLQAAAATSSNGRSVSIHPDEALLAEGRRR